SLGAQRFEHVTERLAVQIAVVILSVRQTVVAVEELVLSIAVEPADQVRLEIQAHGLVEALIDDHADGFESLVLLRAREMLPHARRGVHGFADVELSLVALAVDNVYDGPVRVAGVIARPRVHGAPLERDVPDAEAGHSSSSLCCRNSVYFVMRPL